MTQASKKPGLKRAKRSKAAAVLDRVKEPSTMAGLSVLLMLLGVPPGVPEAVVNVAAAALAVGSVFTPEGGGRGDDE